ncbi:hypothetical protein [Actinoplanes aureus]|uniref:Uncharacterized protein n=1 Tax=Actinoplanes aureus TaxID=2792083 RepID=A0A931CQC2_9ACTN|nr:hypothetical protein [Actinoplanes aureus]MBG0569170.1 hypothetical protein [Actinoplanes aureus]
MTALPSTPNTARSGPTVIPGFAGTRTHRAAVALVVRHHHDGTGRCACCRHPFPCPTRTGALHTCAAASEPLTSIPPDTSYPATATTATTAVTLRSPQ